VIASQSTRRAEQKPESCGYDPNARRREHHGRAAVSACSGEPAPTHGEEHCREQSV